MTRQTDSADRQTDPTTVTLAAHAHRELMTMNMIHNRGEEEDAVLSCISTETVPFPV